MTNAVMASGGVTAQSWTLAYDEDNRTTSIQWSAGTTNVSVVNRYDALGRRISKTVNGVTNGCVLLLVGGMEKVLCDLDGNGNVTAWYVHGPDLCYRVDSTNGLLCYHADAQGNVIALTDGNTNLVAQYAYTPYGRSLGSTNFQSQFSNPYLFVGSQGVQEESDIPNLYFMRARYYSADAGVFLSTDPVKHIGAGWKPVAYSYAGLNPISQSDPDGELFGEDDLWALGIGAAIGVIDTTEQDIILRQRPSLQQYAANAWGGAVGADLYLNTVELTGNVYLAGFVGGTANAFARDTFNAGVDSLTGTKNNTTVPVSE
jgi:RHS repeat-associated protein